jgi:hypothetical protein
LSTKGIEETDIGAARRRKSQRLDEISGRASMVGVEVYGIGSYG